MFNQGNRGRGGAHRGNGGRGGRHGGGSSRKQDDFRSRTNDKVSDEAGRKRFPPRRFQRPPQRNNSARQEVQVHSVENTKAKEAVVSSLAPFDITLAPGAADSIRISFVNAAGLQGTTVLYVRTGEHIFFARSALKKFEHDCNLPGAVLAISLISQALIADKDAMVMSRGTPSDLTIGLSNVDFQLPPMTWLNIYGINRMLWCNNEVQMQTMSYEMIVPHCIRRTNGLIAIQHGRCLPGTRITVFLGRYLSCIDDPYIVGAYMASRLNPGNFFTPDELELSTKLRIKQMLFNGGGPLEQDITLNWENCDRVFPVNRARADTGTLRDFCYMFGIHPVAVIDDLPPRNVAMSVDQLKIASMNLSLWSKDMFEARKYSATESFVTESYLVNTIVGCNANNDPFESLGCSPFVNYNASAADYITARYGPGNLNVGHNFITFCLVTDRYQRPEIAAISDAFMIGNVEYGPVVRNQRCNLAGAIYAYA